MPNYQDHLLFGAVLVLLFTYLVGSFLSYGVEAILVSVAFILLASVFPDVDHAGSVVHRKLKAFLVVLTAALPITVFYPDPVHTVGGAVAAGGATAILFEQVKPHHRGITHTYPAAVVFATFTGILSMLLFNTFVPAVFAFIAYLSHILLDRAT